MRVLVCAILLALVGCEEAPAPAEETVAPAAEVAEAPALPPSIYDANGELLESDVVVAGLTLPRGLELEYERDREHSYTSRAPIEKLQRYFGPRLNTGAVDRVGQGAVFRQALPRGVTGGEVRLDVSIMAGSSGAIRVHVQELLPPPPPRTEADVRAAWEAAVRDMD